MAQLPRLRPMTARVHDSGDDDRREPLSIGLSMQGAVPRVIVAGELARGTERMLEEYLDTVAATFADRIELDLRGVGHVDPAGVRFLVRARQRFSADRLAILP